MKKIKYIILMAFLAYLTIGATCEEHFVDLPVVGYVEHTFPVTSLADYSYSESESVDFSEEINKLRHDNNFDSIKSIAVESVTFTVLNNASGAGASITGTAQVSSPIGAPLVPLTNMNGLVLANIVGVEQNLTLLEAGVNEINEAIDIETGNGQLSISVNGSANTTLNFDLLVKITFTIVGQIKTEVPVI